ncbi:MAG: lipid-A-disaccharide synthase N-terminal domain-containing protein [Bacteroidales bacterium]|nr:lipid-A-disaccharide synthase N-terminal domain-containing protein [Bacteroidales bacterium]
MDSPLWVYILGLVGMAVYGSRILIQWYISEKSKQVESPGIYWVLSSLGAMLLYVYGWLRKDFSILFGESVSYYIYMWNISIMGLYKNVPKIVVWLQGLFPVVILALIVRDFPSFTANFLANDNIPLWLLLFGVAGQFTYEIRSVYQLVYSYRRKESILPLGHWVLAVIGSVMIITYGIIRHDWVLVIGQFAVVFSIRNIMIYFAAKKRERLKNQ